MDVPKRPMAKIGHLICIMLLAGFPAAASAMYKCVDANATTSFQDSPCLNVHDKSYDPVIGAKGPMPIEATEASQPGAAQQATNSRPDPKATAATQAKPEAKPGGLTTWQKVSRGLMLVSGVVGIILFLKFVTTVLETGRTGLGTWVAAISLAIAFQSALVGVGGLSILWKPVSVFAYAFAYMWLFKTNYIKGLIISSITYALFVALPPMVMHMAMAQPSVMTSFSPPGQAFTVTMPGTPHERPSAADIDGAKPQIYELETDQGVYLVTYVDHPTPPANVADFLDQARDSLSSRSKSLNLVKERKVWIEGNEGRDLLYGMLGGSARYRYFFVGARLYVLAVIMRPGEETSPDFDAYLDSFHLK